MWNWTSAAGRPGRVRTNATTSATRRGERPCAAQHPLGQVPWACRRRRASSGRETSQSTDTNGWSWRLLPDAGQLVADRPRRPRAGRRRGPMPRSSSSCGEPIAPAAEDHLALGAHQLARPCGRRSRTPTARPPSSSTPDLGAGAAPSGSGASSPGAGARRRRSSGGRRCWLTWDIDGAVLLRARCSRAMRGMPAASLASSSRWLIGRGERCSHDAQLARPRRGTPTRRARCPRSA